MIFVHFYPQKQLLGNELAGSDTLECDNEILDGSPATTSADEGVEPFFGIPLASGNELPTLRKNRACSGEDEQREDGRSPLLPGQDVDTMTATASQSSPILKSVAN